MGRYIVSINAIEQLLEVVSQGLRARGVIEGHICLVVPAHPAVREVGGADKGERAAVAEDVELAVQGSRRWRRESPDNESPRICPRDSK